jgi:hypothetical protein
MQVATPQSEIYQKLLDIGWTLKSIDFKNGVYIAKAKNDTTGQDAERAGKSPELALAQVYRYAQQAYTVRRHAALQKVGSWDSSWLDQKDEIAQAYSKMPAFDEKAVPAWKALAAESKVQADAIRQQITVEVVDEGEPYATAQEMVEDIHKNKHFKVSRANSEHPVWSVEDNVNFRIVHDVIGHAQSGGDFSWRGENLACGVHFPLVSPLAREALFTECIGQTAYRSYYKGFGPQKIGFLSQFLHPVQEKQGEHIWAPHGGLPQLQPSPNMSASPEGAAGMAGVFNGPGDWVNPSQTEVMQAPPSPVFGLGQPLMQGYQDPSKVSKDVGRGNEHDPNTFWEPALQVAPLQDPADDYIDAAATAENAAKVDTGWQEKDESTQKKAIMNAFRVALLSPRKHLKWNAAHYQALMHADPGTKAVDLWNMLEDEREKHNQKLGYPEGSHLAYRKQLEFLANELKQDLPGISDAEALKQAKTIVFNKTKEFEEQIGADPANEGTSELRRYNMARKLVTQWLRDYYTPQRGWSPGQEKLVAKTADQAQLFDTGDDWGGVDQSGFANEESKYGAFMGGHLDAIEQVGAHIDEIRDAALKDLDEGGKGLIFRQKLMNMNLKGVNPKVASFAWLLLAPLTSELGIIDTHIARGMRRDPNKISVKDYYKLERMQRAAKDATGYSHMPLGMYHWGLWDAIRNPGEHSDHSPLRILDPLPWDSPDAKWDASQTAKSGPWVGPMQFEDARGNIEGAARDFDQEFAQQPHGKVPVVYPPQKSEEIPSLYTVPAL